MFAPPQIMRPLLALAAAAALVSVAHATSSTAAAKPNVLWVLTDDQVTKLRLPGSS